MLCSLVYNPQIELHLKLMFLSMFSLLEALVREQVCPWNTNSTGTFLVIDRFQCDTAVAPS